MAIEVNDTPQRRRRGKPPAPISPGRVDRSGNVTGRKGIGDWIIWHFADTGKFYSLKDIQAKVDPDIQLNAYTTAIGVMKRSSKVAVEMQPGARGNHRYRFSKRTDRLISLDEIETQFEHLIADFLKQAELPVSHQSAGRYRAAAAQLRKLLDQWAE
ncbi:hypothetical protein LJR235_002856 [Pararhizobium sp. LjRoot235]|uniref:hypothetical protein n=1 Tax=Pararhizobium sp. LjRoot235 TaxID=3342291 RepID=UPI003ED096E3